MKLARLPILWTNPEPTSDNQIASDRSFEQAYNPALISDIPNLFHPNHSLTYLQVPVGVGWPMPTP